MQRITVLRIMMLMVLGGLALTLLNSAQSQNFLCISRCQTVEKECSDPYVTQCKSEATAAAVRCEDAGGTSAACQASYDNTYRDCMSRNGSAITTCMNNAGCRRCTDFRMGLSYYCECGNPYSGDEGCGLTFDGGYSNPCDCDPYDPSCTSPIVIDLENNGYRLTNVALGVRFDLRAIGTAIQTAWTEPDSDDAWLVLDRNGNGRIDDGSELFGNVTPQPDVANKNGFLALAEYDKTLNGGNDNRTIDNRDPVFTSLRVWQDRNHNGLAEPTELIALPDAGVEDVSLEYKESKHMDRNGNVFRYRAKVNGMKYAYDVFLTHQ